MRHFIFDQRKTVTLNEEPTQEVENVTDDNCASLADNPSTSAVRATIESTTVKSRKTRPINWEQKAAITVLLIPVVMLVIELLSDPATQYYVAARLCRMVKNESGAIKFYSMSLSKKQDSIVLKERADTYAAIHDLSRERDDLLQIVKLNTKDWYVYTRAMTLEALLGNLKSASTICKQSAAKMTTLYGSDYYIDTAIYELLLLDQTSMAKQLLHTAENDDQRALLALIQREDGHSQPIKTSSSTDDNHLSIFRDSRLKYYDNSGVELSFQVLLALDNAQTAETRRLIEEMHSRLVDKEDLDEPIINVLEAWLLLSEGRENECLNLTKSTLKETSLQESIVGLNCKAALHLIRKRVFLQQKNESLAAKEEHLYKECGCTGRLFTPLCYRQ